MKRIEHSALVPFSGEQMYRLVADIPRYPEFLKWCAGASIVSDHADQVVARISVGFRGVNESFTTRNTMSPFESIRLELVDGPFSEFDGCWRFTALEANASKIALSLGFEISNPIKRRILGPAFSYIAHHQIEAFQSRAEALYGT